MFARGHARRVGGCSTEFCDPPKKCDTRGSWCTFSTACRVWSLDTHQARMKWFTCGNTSLKRNVCITIDHSEMGAFVLDTATVAKAKRVRGERAEPTVLSTEWHDTDKRMIWDMRIKIRLLSGVSTRGTLCFHWNYRLFPSQLPLSAHIVGSALSCHSHITPNVGNGTSHHPQTDALINWALNPLQ